jgi:phospholipid/cholesterol/gamma-HCH transport system permease protein
MFVVGAALNFLAAYLVVVRQVGETSQGQWQRVHWEYVTVGHLGYDLVWVLLEGTMIVLIGMYYGYRASGGPVGVGTATARSMIFNIVAIHVLGAFLILALFGVYPTVPIGG